MTSFRVLLFALFFCITFSFSLHTFAQKKPFKVGKVSAEDFEKRPEWEGFPAVVLGEYGQRAFAFLPDGDVFMSYTSMQRIYILNDAGLNYANFKIRYHNKKKYTKELRKLKAYVHTLHNGEVVTQKIDPEHFQETKEGKGIREVKIAIPGVKVGSIIELSYNLYHPASFEIPTWYFQRKIPVLWSEYLVTLPDFLDYTPLYQGYEPFHIRKVHGVVQAGRQYKRYQWVVKDAPAVVPEPYIGSIDKYTNYVLLQFKGTIDPITGERNTVLSAWDDLAKMMLDKEEKEYAPFFTQTTYGAKVDSTITEEREKAIEICKQVKREFREDDYIGVFPNVSVKKCIAEKKGNNAAINLMLVGLLRQSGLEAYPVAVRLRSSGRINKVYPMVSQLDYLVTEVVLKNGETLLMDAASRATPADVLPEYALNDWGWRVAYGQPHWVTLQTEAEHHVQIVAQQQLNEEGVITSTNRLLFKDYAAYDVKEALSEGQESTSALHEEGEEHDYFTQELVDSVKIDGIDDPKAPLAISYDVKYTLEEGVGKIGKQLYILPLFEFSEDEVPFKNEKRKYPIELPYKLSKRYIGQIELPEGLKVEELPEPVQIVLPQGAGSFTFHVTEASGNLQVFSDYKLNQKIFPPQALPLLREFFSAMIKAHKTPIVLSK